MTDQLREALARWHSNVTDVDAASLLIIRDVVHRVLGFPSSEAVEAAARAIGAYMRPTLSWQKYASEHEMYRSQAAAALEAARQADFGGGVTMTDQLRQALALYRNKAFVVLEVSPELLVIVEAAEAWLEFPTDAQVEAAWSALDKGYVTKDMLRDAFEAAHNTGQTIIPDYDGEVQGRWPQ